MTRRILQVVTDTDRRGAQVFACDLGRALEDAGADVRTVALAAGTVGGLELPVLGRTRMGVESLRALRREARGAAVVVAHGSSTLPASAIATFGLDVPFVYRQISDSRFWASTWPRRMRVRAGLQRAAAVVALWKGSADTLHDLFGLDRAKVHVVPNGVPPDAFGPATAEERVQARARFGLDGAGPVVLSIGALAPEKGVDVAMRAMARIDGARLLVVGDGPQRDELERLARELGAERFVFAGGVESARVAYDAADGVVLSSLGGDSMPAVLIEASLCALPIVATPIEAIPEVVVSDVTGVLVPVGSVDAVERAVRDLLDQPARARQMGEAGRAHCLEQFAIAPVAQRWLAVLRSVAPDAGRSH